MNYDPQLTETLSILERIASNYPSDSPEYDAVKIAAQSLLYVQSEVAATSFKNYLAGFDQSLNEQQREQLVRFGIVED